MAIEKAWERVSPRAFTADGTADGIITLPFALDFKVKQRVTLRANTVQSKVVEVKRVLSPTQLKVGPIGFGLDKTENVSAFTVALSATVEADEQPRPAIPEREFWRAMFAEEPTVAMRSHLVDYYGRSYEVNNPLPVRLSDGSVNIGTVNAELEVQLSHQDNSPDPGDVHDSVRIGDGVTEAKVDPQNRSFSTNRYEKLLGLLSNANWMKLGDFEAITPIFVGDVATLEYKQDGAVIGRAIFTFVTDSNWNLQLERYVNDADGQPLQDDDGSLLFLD